MINQFNNIGGNFQTRFAHNISKSITITQLVGGAKITIVGGKNGQVYNISDNVPALSDNPSVKLTYDSSKDNIIEVPVEGLTLKENISFEGQKPVTKLVPYGTQLYIYHSSGDLGAQPIVDSQFILNRGEYIVPIVSLAYCMEYSFDYDYTGMAVVYYQFQTENAGFYAEGAQQDYSIILQNEWAGTETGLACFARNSKGEKVDINIGDTITLARVIPGIKQPDGSYTTNESIPISTKTIINGTNKF